MKYVLSFISLVGFLSIQACVSLDEANKPKTKPELSADMSEQEIIAEAASFGGASINEAAVILAKKDVNVSNKVLQRSLLQANEETPQNLLLNYVLIWRKINETPDFKFFSQLIDNEQSVLQDLGFSLVGYYRSPVTQKFLDQKLSQILINNPVDDPRLQSRSLAVAVRLNNLSTAYSIMRQAFLSTGFSEFVKTMIFLNPVASSSDCLSYMAQADVEDLRQLSQQTVNAVSATYCLNHMMAVSPSVGHENFDVIFSYAVSRNPSLADRAQHFIIAHMPDFNQTLAAKLAMQPVWLQVALIENFRRKLTPQNKEFLRTYKSFAATKAVVDELKFVN